MTVRPDGSPAHNPQDDFDVHLPPTPYPGLRPFQKHEWPIFFGREAMSDEVIARLIEQRFVVVHGDSGCGKSSLLRAGVLARLEQEHAGGRLTWRTCAAEPGDAPLLNLARSLAQLDGRPDEARTLEIRRVLNFGKDAPAALASMLVRGNSDHICILLDQFEELFGFAKSQGRDEPGLLVQMLVGLLEKPPRGLYAVATMRSEFLGACAQFDGFAEAVNRTQYLLPRMVQADLVRAVRDPATLYGGQVARELAERLILDAGSGQDELPLIQHGLMLLHRRKTAGAPDGAPWRLEPGDYRVHVAQLLSDHADSLCEKAGAGHGPVIERVFRALTDINADGQAIRRKQSVADLMRVTGTDVATLEKILLPFRVDGASLLRPYGAGALTPTDRVDISHEALIRCWRRIADPATGWLRREFQDGLIWQSLRVQAQSFKQDRSNVLSPATARERAAWIAERNEAWSERYKNEWPLVQELVRDSVEAARKTLAAESKRRRVLTGSILLAAVLSPRSLSAFG